MHMRRISRADPAKTVGRGGGNTAHAALTAAGLRVGAQQLQSYRMRGHAYTDGFLTAGYGVWHLRSAFENQGQWAGPKSLGQCPRH